MPALDVIQAQLRSLLANINRNDKVRSDPFEPREFLLFSEAQGAEPESGSGSGARQAEQEVQTVNGLTAGDWQLAMFLRAWQAREQHLHSSSSHDKGV